MTRLIPTPDVQADLCSARDWHAGMDCLLVPPAILIKIGPKDCCALPGLECHAWLRTFPTLNKLAPVLTLRRLNARKIGSATGAFGRDVDHESAHSPRGPRSGRPVVVVSVVARLIVSLRPETLDEGFLRPALDVQSALLDTLDRLIALDERLLRFPDCFVRRLNAFVKDCGDLPFVLAVPRQLAVVMHRTGE